MFFSSDGFSDHRSIDLPRVGGSSFKKVKKQKKKKDIHTQNSFLQQSYVIPAAHTKRAQTNVFFSFDIALFADSITECVCVREKEVSSTHGQLKRARSKSTRKDYLNKNLEKKQKLTR